MRIICSAAALLHLMVTGLAATPWQSIDGWDIHIDTSENNACFAQRLLDDGTTVYFGFDASLSGGFFAIHNPAWTNVEQGQTGEVTFDFGNEIFAGQAVGTLRDGIPGGHAYFNNPAFAEAIARYVTVTITGARGATFSLSLTGTYKAVEAVRACQSAQPEQ